MELDFIRVCPQRHKNDCCVCCLVMLTGVSYEAALIAIGSVKTAAFATNGLYFTEVKRVAKKLGFELRSVRKGRYSLTESVGILGARFWDGQKHVEHAVLLFHGMVIDPDGGKVFATVDAYKKSGAGTTIGSLLVMV